MVISDAYRGTGSGGNYMGLDVQLGKITDPFPEFADNNVSL